MKFLKTFEKFHSTGLEDGKDEELPTYNPKVQKEASDYVDDLPPNRKMLLFSIVGMEEPEVSDKDFDDKFEIAKKKFVNYFQSNPQLSVGLIDIENFEIPKKGGDGVPRVQSIGGSSQTNSFRVGL